MEPEIYDALIDLKRSVDQQTELQEEANGLMRSLIDALQNTGQATADLAELLEKKSGEVPAHDIGAMVTSGAWND